jgi:hypothetical protein
MDAIGARWYAYVNPQRASLPFGTARVAFHLDEQGHATDIKVLSNTSDAAFGDLCTQSVAEALLPELTPEILARPKDRPTDLTINFTLYSE